LIPIAFFLFPNTGVYYCKPHFKQLFSSKGNYSEGFGKLKPQQEFESKRGTDSPQTTTSPAASSNDTPASPMNTDTEADTENAEKPAAASAAPTTSASPAAVDKPTESSPVAVKAVFEKSAGTGGNSESPKVGTNTKCEVCTKTVYPMEEVKADGKIFHKSCFRCSNCDGVLKLGSYASMDGKTSESVAGRVLIQLVLLCSRKNVLQAVLYQALQEQGQLLGGFRKPHATTAARCQGL
jgi:hypothetical protein